MRWPPCWLCWISRLFRPRDDFACIPATGNFRWRIDAADLLTLLGSLDLLAVWALWCVTQAHGRQGQHLSLLRRDRARRRGRLAVIFDLLRW